MHDVGAHNSLHNNCNAFTVEHSKAINLTRD